MKNAKSKGRDGKSFLYQKGSWWLKVILKTQTACCLIPGRLESGSGILVRALARPQE